MTRLPARGEIWWCEPKGAGRRPVLVLSRDPAIRRFRRSLVAPCTTAFRGIATEVELDPVIDPIPLPAVVNLDSIESVSIEALVEWVGRLDGERMAEVYAAMALAVGSDV